MKPSTVSDFTKAVGPMTASSDLISRRRALATAGGGFMLQAAMNLMRPSSAMAAAPAAGRAKRVIYLFQSGGPSHIDMFDPKPALNKLAGQELPPSVRNGQRLTGMSAGQSKLPLAASPYRFAPQGPAGLSVSELVPHM